MNLAQARLRCDIELSVFPGIADINMLGTLHAKAMASSRRVSPVPSGFHNVTPYLSVDGALNALEFYKKAFGAKEIKKERHQTPDGKIIHCRFKIGDSLIMMSDRFSDKTKVSEEIVTLHVYSKNVDKLWKEAVANGARVTMPIDDMYWGERYGQFVDPFGTRWSVSMRINMSKEEMKVKEKAAMAMFDQERHPGD
jgi:PhnB protein